MIKGRAAPAKYTSKTPCGWGWGYGWGVQKEPETVASADGLRAVAVRGQKEKAPHACAHPLLYTGTHLYRYTHTGHTNAETVPTPAHPPSLHLGTAGPMAPYRVTPVYRQEIGPDVLTKAA